MMKKILLPAAAVFAAVMMTFPCVHAENVNGWKIDNAGDGIAEISSDEVYDGAKALHISGAEGEITVSHPMHGIESVQRKYKVTFYAKGEYNEENIMVGWGNKTEADNHEVISYMNLAHEKIEKNSAKNGWTEYTYTVRQKAENNADFVLNFKDGCGEIYIDEITVEFDGVANTKRDESGYNFGGQGILSGDFEDAVTSETGDDLADYGWSKAQNSISGLTAAGGTDVESAARVVYSPSGNRSLYVKFNSFERNDEKALVLTKKADISDTNFYVTFRMKGAYLPSAVSVAGSNDSKWQALAGGVGSSFENYYGTYVTAEKEADGWTKYKVRTGGEGSVLRIRISGGCLGAYIDDVKLENSDGEAIAMENGSFEEVYYNDTERFAENWTPVSINDSAFVQRVIFNRNPAVYVQTGEKIVGFYGKTEIDPSKEYIVSFENFAAKGRNGLKAGFGTDTENFEGITLDYMEKTELGNGKIRYSFTAQGRGDSIVITSSGVCGGIYVDNVSVKEVGGEELIKNGDFSEKAKPPVYTATKYKLYKNNSEVENISTGVFKVNTAVENNYAEPEQTFTLILCHVRDGEMIKYNTASIKLQPNGQEDEETLLECSINLSDYADGDKLEVYLWDDTSEMNSLRSYCVYGTL